LAQPRGREPLGVRHQLHHQHAVEVAVRLGHAHAGVAQLIQGVDLGVLPGGLLLLAAVAGGLADRTGLAAAAHLAALLVLHALLEAALRHVLVDLRAPHLVAAAHHVDGGLLATLERAQYLVDHAVVDQRLQAVGGLHGVLAWGPGHRPPARAAYLRRPGAAALSPRRAAGAPRWRGSKPNAARPRPMRAARTTDPASPAATAGPGCRPAARSAASAPARSSRPRLPAPARPAPG